MGNYSDRHKQTIIKGLKKGVGTTDQFELVDWKFKDTIEQWSEKDSTWDKRLYYHVKFDYKKNNIIEKSEAYIALFINKDSVNNAVIFPR